MSRLGAPVQKLEMRTKQAEKCKGVKARLWLECVNAWNSFYWIWDFHSIKEAHEIFGAVHHQNKLPAFRNIMPGAAQPSSL